MYKVYDIIRTFLFHVVLSYRSRLNGVSRWKVFSILSRLYVKALRNPSQTGIVSFPILQFQVSAYSYGDLLYLFKEIFLNKDYFFVTSSKKPFIIDCGGNIGMAVLYFKSLYPDASIITFEPNPFAFEVLKRNVEQNLLKDVTLYNIALGADNGIVELHIGENKGSLLASIVENIPGKNHVNVPMKRLSDFIGQRQIDFIKIDVEGAEHYILKDLYESQCLNRSVHYTVEYHHKTEPGKSALADFVRPFEKENFGYTIHSEVDPSRNFQNLLIKFKRNIA